MFYLRIENFVWRNQSHGFVNQEKIKHYIITIFSFLFLFVKWRKQTHSFLHKKYINNLQTRISDYKIYIDKLKTKHKTECSELRFKIAQKEFKISTLKLTITRLEAEISKQQQKISEFEVFLEKLDLSSDMTDQNEKPKDNQQNVEEKWIE